MVPAVAGLKRSGAGRGAALSFLISTPETGADSIPLTYALMDPLMAVIRPVVAFMTAVIAGVAEHAFNPDAGPATESSSAQGPAAMPMAAPLVPAVPLRRRLAAGLRFAFVDLLGDIGPLFGVGLLLAGVISQLMPATLINGYLGNPLTAMLVMLVVGLPMYVCATASTPVAAALVMQGLNPGAALVFLLVGPATNAANLSMVSGMFGRRTLAIYLISISGCALIFGALTDMLYTMGGITPETAYGQAVEWLPPAVQWVSAAALAILIAWTQWLKRRPRKAASCQCGPVCNCGGT